MVYDFMLYYKEYGLATAWYNLRFMIAWDIARFLLQKDIRLTVKSRPHYRESMNELYTEIEID